MPAKSIAKSRFSGFLTIVILSIFLKCNLGYSSTVSGINQLNKKDLKYLTNSQIIVNSKIITKTEIDERFNFFLKTSKIKTLKQKNFESLYKALSERMIEEELIRQKAPSYKINIDDDELQEHIAIFANKNFQNIESFKDFLTKNNLSFVNFQKQIEAELIWSKIVEDIIRPRVSVSYIEIKEWLEKEKFEKENSKYLLQDYLIGDADKSIEIINKIYQEFKENKNYRRIIEKILFRLTNENDNKGWFWSSELNKKILPEIANLKNNEFSKPVLLEDGWHIFKLCDKRSDLNISSQTYDLIKGQILDKKLEVAIKNYLQDLKKMAYLEFKYVK